MTNMTRSSDSVISNYTTWKGSMAMATPMERLGVSNRHLLGAASDRHRFFHYGIFFCPTIGLGRCFSFFPGLSFFRMFQVPY